MSFKLRSRQQVAKQHARVRPLRGSVPTCNQLAQKWKKNFTGHNLVSCFYRKRVAPLRTKTKLGRKSQTQLVPLESVRSEYSQPAANLIANDASYVNLTATFTLITDLFRLCKQLALEDFFLKNSTRPFCFQTACQICPAVNLRIGRQANFSDFRHFVITRCEKLLHVTNKRVCISIYTLYWISIREERF